MKGKFCRWEYAIIQNLLASCHLHINWLQVITNRILDAEDANKS